MRRIGILVVTGFLAAASLSTAACDNKRPTADPTDRTADAAPSSTPSIGTPPQPSPYDASFDGGPK
jgi:hypothetical protein